MQVSEEERHSLYESLVMSDYILAICSYSGIGPIVRNTAKLPSRERFLPIIEILHFVAGIEI